MAGESYTTKKILLKAVDGTTTQYFIPYVNNATADKTGLVKPDGTTITVDANGTISAQIDISGLQSKIDDDHKLSADLISDGTTNKVVTATEKSTWNGKQDVISDLSTIRTNATAGAKAASTIAGYGDIVTHNADEFLTEHQDISNLSTKEELTEGLNTKQDIISDLDTIREGASKGSTALQSIPSEYVTETELESKGYLTSYTETDPIYTADKPNLALKSELPTKVSSLINDANYQTAAEVAQMIASIPQFEVKIVDELPSQGQKMILYLIPKTSAGGDNIYDEYIWLESTSAFELIGTTTVDLSNYYTKDETNNLLNDKANINQTGNKLGYTDSKLSLEDINGNRLSEVTIKSAPDLDNKTIHLNNSNELEVYGNLTKDGTFKYDWIGTEAEYNTGVADGTITSDTLCLVTDDETELISSASGQTQILIKTTYNDLVQIKNNNKLISGAFYRITDYVTTTNGNSATTSEPSRSAGHQFDIVIQALDESNLSQIGSCSLHEGDTYFANQNINSWKIWYDIDNNINKYNWAVTDGTGKGVIYRMIDEHFNDLPYDFKNIQFYRDKTLPKYANTSSRMTVEDGYYYTFSRVYGGILTDFTLSVSYNERNTMGEYRQGNKLSLPNNIFMIASANGPLSTNNFGISCYNNTVFVGSGFYNNEFTINFMNNIISSSEMGYNKALDNFDGNVIKCSQCYNNVFGQYFATNTLNGNKFKQNYLGHQCYDNVINANFLGNYINSVFTTNTISNTTFQLNVIGNYCRNNNITSGNFVGNNISSYFTNNSIGNNFLYNNISSYFRYNELNLFNYNTTGSGIQNIKLPEKTTNWEIKAGISGSSTSNKLDLTALPSGTGYTANIIRDGSGRVLYTYLSGTEIRGKYKESITSSEWKNLPITEETTT